MLALSSAQLIGLLPPSALIAAVERATRLLQSGEARVPERLHLHWDKNSLLVMPALAGGVFGTKLVSIHPQNAQRGLPVTTGIMVINDAENGAPLALLDAGALTAQRTGAVGALGVKHLTPASASSIGVVGCGVQGAWQAISACAVRPIADLYCVGRSATSIAQFKEQVESHVPQVRITVCQDVRDLLARTNIIITATTSSEPVLPDEPALLTGKHFFSVGSFRPSMQELPDSVYRLAGMLIIDSEGAKYEVGDVINPVEKNILKETDIIHIGELVTGRRHVDPTRTTAFKSVGLAIYDLCVAQAFYQEAARRGIGQEVNL